MILNTFTRQMKELLWLAIQNTILAMEHDWETKEGQIQEGILRRINGGGHKSIAHTNRVVDFDYNIGSDKGFIGEPTKSRLIGIQKRDFF
jgi:hypothetical protein